MSTPRPPSVATAGRRFFLAMAALTAALVALGCVRWYLTLVVYDPAIAQGVRFARALTDGHGSMLNQETGLRGYQASGEPRYLAPYGTGRTEYLRASATAWRLLPEQSFAGRLLHLQQQADAWQAGYAGPQIAVTSQRPARRPTVAAMGRGKVLFDRYRAPYEALLVDARRHNDELMARRERVDRTTSALEVTLAGAALLLAARRRRKLVDELVRPVTEVTQVLHRLADGDAGARPGGYPTGELDDLATGVRTLADAAQRRSAETAAERSAAVARTQVYQRVVAVAHELGGYLDPAELTGALLRGLAQVVDVRCAALWSVSDGRLHAVLSARPHDGAPEPDEVTEEALRFLRLTVTGDRLGCALPVVHGGTVHGLLHLQVGTPLDEDGELAVHNLALAAGGALTAARLHEQVHAESRSDALTGLHNRRRFEEDLQHELGLAGRVALPISLLLLDVDHFKQFNDQRGHRDGDRLLHDLSSLLTLTLRATDSAYRYGGEELAVLLRGTLEQDAVALADRLRATIAARTEVTVSVGVVTAFSDLGPDAVVEAADRALYEAKRSGRNAVRQGSLAAPGVPAQRSVEGDRAQV